MTSPGRKRVRCAIYTRVSTDHGLDQEFNSLDAQRDAAQAYIRSQAHAGWTLMRGQYDDGGYQTARKIIGGVNRVCSFDGRDFPTRAFYIGTPWFLPLVGGWYRFKDRQERRRALQRMEL